MMLKRFLDILASFLGILFLLPVYFILSLLVKIKHGSPILFKQTRPGKDGKPFTFYKFRTMTNETDEGGNLLPDKDRLSSFGSFLRKTSLDELPSLFNVIKGDMSLVGPRPLLMRYLPLYSEFQKRRHEVKPGITGWAQVNGRNALSWRKKFELDVWYIENQSFLSDIKIILLTIYKVLKKEGISSSTSVTMEEFKGTE